MAKRILRKLPHDTCCVLHALRAGRGAHCPSVFVRRPSLLEMSALFIYFMRTWVVRFLSFFSFLRTYRCPFYSEEDKTPVVISSSAVTMHPKGTPAPPDREGRATSCSCSAASCRASTAGEARLPRLRLHRHGELPPAPAHRHALCHHHSFFSPLLPSWLAQDIFIDWPSGHQKDPALWRAWMADRALYARGDDETERQAATGASGWCPSGARMRRAGPGRRRRPLIACSTARWTSGTALSNHGRDSHDENEQRTRRLPENAGSNRGGT